MKPNEGYEIGQEDLIAQLGLLILEDLEGRTPQDVKNNIKDCIECNNDGLSHQRKEDFLSLWKSCDSVYIEVWLCRQEQFKEKEAMNGHSGYLLIEQWEIEIILNRNSEHGFHCTENMLIQAIKSKLYFSQLSAWLSLTKGKFPRHTYFRLCQTENKTSLKRFIRAPDFHQFPQVNITPTKELVVSIHSLPHSNLPQDYPMFSWVLADFPSETPQRKSAEKLPSNFEEDSLVRNDRSSCGRSQEKDHSCSPSHAQVVRKLRFEDRMSAREKTSDQPQITCVVKELDTTSENVNRTSIEHSTCSSELDLSEYFTKRKPSKHFAKEKQNFISDKESNTSCEMAKHEKDSLSLTTRHLDLSRNLITSDLSQEQDRKLFCDEMQCSGVEQEATGFFHKYPEPLTTSAKSFASSSDTENHLLDSFPDTEGCSSSFPRGSGESKEKYVLMQRTSSVSQEHLCDEGICEIMQSLRKSDGISPAYQKTDNSTFVTSQECQRNFTPMEKRCFDSSLNSENFRTNFDSECRNQEISRKSLLTRDLSAGSSRHTILNSDKLQRSQRTKISNRMTYDDLNCKLIMDRKLKNIKQIPVERQRSNSESRNLDETVKKSWSIDKYGNVLHRTKKEIGNILPEVRHVMDKEYEKALDERLKKCCLTREGCCENEQGINRRNTGETEKTGNREDNVFSEPKCTAIPHARDSRYHFRHASTGTLAVFHPMTGLPMSSSPAPFRKTSQKQTVDDICSPSREPSSLSDQCSNLSKSAPTLTAQSLLVNFEESVLNDRLLPDGVVEGFTAELSASGSKKCLAHVTLPVQAYFFKLSDDNAPSPYMGYISLDAPGLPKKGYHVPKKGTIQLTLFNPNQTVVKVFVVLYDFSDMQPNFQTFLRQKTTSLVKSDGLVDRIRDNLHYLIHLRFASSKSGRIYLHTDIRVIFARPPPDQVHLTTTTSGPTNPKYVPRQDTQEEF